MQLSEISFSTETLPLSASWQRVAWNGTVFCAVAYNSDVAATSSDGISWVQRTLPSSTFWRDIAWNGSVFCVVQDYGDQTIAATSPDGVDWTSRTLPFAIGWAGVVGAPGVIVAIAKATTNVAKSVDNGASWSSHTMPSLPTGRRGGVYGNGTYVVVPASGSTYITSTDGETWTARAFGATFSSSGHVAWNGAVFCATSTSGVRTSTDGVTWTARSIGTVTGAGVTSVAAAIGWLIVTAEISFAHKILLSNNNGATWTAVDNPAGDVFGAVGKHTSSGAFYAGVRLSTAQVIIGSLTPTPPPPPITNRSGLIKPLITTVIPGSPGVAGSPASTVCTPNPPPQPPPPQPPPPPPAVYGYIYVPNNPSNPAAGEVRTPWYTSTPPAGYQAFWCTNYMVPDPNFPNGYKFVYECRSYWNYP